MDDILQGEESQRFFSLIHMLQRSAMMHLGMIPDESGMIHFNMGEAKAAIDLLGTLETRTKGNLEDVEETLLRGLISELKMHFVRAPERQQEIEAEMKRQEELKETFTSPDTAPSDTLIDDEEE
ncbi:MAG: DUF1844 domain-containing protein [Candidatus Thalassarchaeum sp.]|jgi:hypothetical protein|nr:DUF1844 domain-containing protein [Candidatus Thalassarchaeum sp.]|tara:strand:- start:2416 stop:2787 length:372 start_codon:yes stop_codon:yes gene_type:complete